MASGDLTVLIILFIYGLALFFAPKKYRDAVFLSSPDDVLSQGATKLLVAAGIVISTISVLLEFHEYRVIPIVAIWWILIALCRSNEQLREQVGGDQGSSPTAPNETLQPPS